MAKNNNNAIVGLNDALDASLLGSKSAKQLQPLLIAHESLVISTAIYKRKNKDERSRLDTTDKAVLSNVPSTLADRFGVYLGLDYEKIAKDTICGVSDTYDINEALLLELAIESICGQRPPPEVAEIKEMPCIVSKTPFTKYGERKTTLIVCPASVVNNWQTQLHTHIHPTIINRLKLRVCMKSFKLRRTKHLLGTLLPKRQMQLIKVKMDHEHAKVYHTLYASAKMIFDQIARLGDDVVSKNYTSVLETILRLRQCCDSPALIPSDRLQKAKELLGILKLNQDKDHVLTADEAAALMAKLKQALYSTNTRTNTTNGTSAHTHTPPDTDLPMECAICMNDFEGDTVASIIRSCGHVFCQDCLRRLCPSKSALCPVCRRPFQKSDVIDGHHLDDVLESSGASRRDNTIDLSQDDDDLAQHLKESPTITDPKTTALIGLVNALPRDEKMVVFSQFTKYLDVVEEALLDSGIEPMRFDGQTRMAHRGEMINTFNTKPSAKVILISLHAGGTGINLTRANHVCLLDLWWNPAVEDQAMDRVYRIGQTRDVRVLRFVLEDSIEEKILDLQETKRVLSTGALNKLSAEETRKLLVTQLRSLFSAEAKIITD